jgi:Ca2+-binding RTX toxin-like protein
MPRSRPSAVALSSVVAILAALAPVQASAAIVRCFGERATIVGTAHADKITGTDKSDVIAGLGGQDVIKGKGKDDLICAGPGADHVKGGKGEDLIFGEKGSDVLEGNGGEFNQVVPGPGNDVASGGPSGGDELIYLDATTGVTVDAGAGIATGWGNDEFSGFEWFAGSDSDDTLTGTDAPDLFEFIFGAGGNDVVDGGGGDINVLAGGDGDDTMIGGAGFDFLIDFFASSYYDWPLPPGPMVVNLPGGTLTGNGNDTLSMIDGSQGSLLDDVMIGDGGHNEFTTLLDGDDTVDAGDGDDLVDGGEGADDLDGGAGVDELGNLDAEAGMTVDLSTAMDSHGDTLAGFEDVLGTFFDDTLTGDAGPNLIEGASGADTIAGLGGDDKLFGDFIDGFLEDVDSVDGGDGTDICEGETQTNCEEPPPPLEFSSLRSSVVEKSFLYGGALR